ncbi:MAG: P1 family peptidase [Clostridiales bacterium]|nr:P1 family peptidase [Clostridiales bacterium]
MGLTREDAVKLFRTFERGKKNLITDVPGVKVGHVTLADGEIQTGVTAILPHPDNLFREKLFAGVSVINGFGKSAGLIQIQELGTLESPIIMTNTLSVGTALTACVRYMLEENPEIGVETGTVNCVVTECNDGELNDIRGLHVREEHVREAIRSAGEVFEEGAVGGGRGMEMMGLKGGIGSASRVLNLEGRAYTIGAIAMTNYGTDDNLVVGGDPVGRRIQSRRTREDKGSCIIVIGTDIPLIDRQLRRVALRATHALARTGSYSGNGSGDIALAFSTANRVEHFNKSKFKEFRMLYDEELSPVFEATVEAVEEALLSSLFHGETVQGIRGKTLKSLREYL